MALFKVSRRSFLGISNNKQTSCRYVQFQISNVFPRRGLCSPNNGDSLSANSEGGHLGLFERGKRYWQNWVCLVKLCVKLLLNLNFVLYSSPTGNYLDLTLFQFAKKNVLSTKWCLHFLIEFFFVEKRA